MITPQIYIIASVVVLALIFVLFIFFVKKHKKRQNLTPLAGLSFGFILAGLIFNDDRLVCYSLFGVGILLAVVDMIIKLRKRTH